MTEDPKKPLGRILLQQRAITQPQLDRALAQKDDQPLATRLLEAGAVNEVQALKALSEQSGVPGIDLSQICIRLSDLAILPREIAQRHKILPVLVREDRIFLAMAAPTDKKVIDELEFVTGKRVFPYIALAGPLLRIIAAGYEMRERGESHYVGPNCPPEVLRKAGVITSSAPPSPMRPARPLPGEPAPPPAVPRAVEPEPLDLRANAPAVVLADPPELATRGSPDARAPAGMVVVDDAMQKMAAADELTDSDFGQTGSELSVVADMPREPVPAKPGQRTVLVVDDEPEIRRLLRRVFEDRGFRVLEADRGLAALRLVKEEPPDVMILDAMLPEVHGFDIAKRIKGTERYGHIPIVMISAVYRGWRFAEDLKASYGVEAYLEKPFKIPEVVAAVQGALEKKGGRTDPEALSAHAEALLAEGIAAYQRGDMEAAIQRLTEGTRIDPLAYRLHFHLGLLYGKQGQLYDAIQSLETALHINGKQFPALKNLAVLYQKAGFRNKAIETWERALVVAPDDATRQSIREHLLGLL